MKKMNVHYLKYIHLFFTSAMGLCLIILLGCSGNMRTGDVEIAGV